MSMPEAIPDMNFKRIEDRTEAIEADAMKVPELWDDLQKDREAQKYFLNNFRKTFNVSLSLSLVGRTMRDYNRWKFSDIYFVHEYNGIHDQWKNKIMASAATRAVGYLTSCDPKAPTVSGYVEDAAGVPIYSGADSRLSMRFLETLYPEFSPKTEVTVNNQPVREIAEDDDGATAGDIYSQMVQRKSA